MNKHIVGFILFNLIVGTSVIIAVLSYNVPNFDSVVVPATSETYTRSCWKSSRKYANNLDSVKVTQAVFDGKTQQLETELFVQSNVKSFKNIKLALNFFVKDGDSTRYLATEDLSDRNMDMEAVYDFSDRRITKANFHVSTSSRWLDDIGASENLYVVPQIISNSEVRGNYTPVFSEADATPVTLAR